MVICLWPPVEETKNKITHQFLLEHKDFKDKNLREKIGIFIEFG